MQPISTPTPTLHPASVGETTWNADVYEPSDDSFLLADAVLQQLPGLNVPQHPVCLEVGCGSGYVICSLALGLQQLSRPPGLLLCTDLTQQALLATQQTLANHQVAGVQLLQDDLLSTLLPRLHQQVWLLLFNPPYVPTPDDEVERPGIARAWAGGHQGRRVIDRCLPQLAAAVAVGGHIFILLVPENVPQDICNVMALKGFQSEGRVVLRRAADEEHLLVLHLHRVSEGPISASQLS